MNAIFTKTYSLALTLTFFAIIDKTLATDVESCTKAITLDFNNEHSLLGNRSYCYQIDGNYYPINKINNDTAGRDVLVFAYYFLTTKIANESFTSEFAKSYYNDITTKTNTMIMNLKNEGKANFYTIEDFIEEMNNRASVNVKNDGINLIAYLNDETKMVLNKNGFEKGQSSLDHFNYAYTNFTYPNSDNAIHDFMYELIKNFIPLTSQYAETLISPEKYCEKLSTSASSSSQTNRK